MTTSTPISTSVHTTLSELSYSTVAFDASEQLVAVRDFLAKSEDVPGVLVTHHGKLCSLISRDTIFRNLSRAFAQEIFLSKPIHSFLEQFKRSHLELQGDCSVHRAADLALSRGAETCFEPIVIRLESGEYGLIDSRKILAAQSVLLGLSAHIELKRARAEAANAAKSQYLTTMSHELRTPLNGVLGMNELLLTTELTDQQRQYIQASITCGESLLTLINDVLDLAKIESGKLELNLRECRLEPVVDGVISMFSHAAAQKGLNLSYQLDPELSAAVICDDTRVRQILVNLVGNAVKFTTTGEVLLDGRCIRRNQDLMMVRFAISDTGLGIPEHRLNSLFSPFTQVDSSTARQFGGSGLGLAICKQLAEMMGGNIGAKSELGVGSIFWVELPLPLVAEQESRFPDIAAITSHLPGQYCTTAERARIFPAHILVAEDNSINQLFVRELLKHCGCTCDIANNGDEALTALQHNRYDLALMDCQMPEMDGFTATREIRRREAVGELPGRLPIIALTANALIGDRDRCLESGMDDYLSKPLQAGQLQAMLAKFLTAHSAHPAP